MLLLTYDPNVKQISDYKASLISPYFNEEEAAHRHLRMWEFILYGFAMILPRAEVQ